MKKYKMYCSSSWSSEIIEGDEAEECRIAGTRMEGQEEEAVVYLTGWYLSRK
jgi:hypothetical protein